MADFEAAERAKRGEPVVAARRPLNLPSPEEIEREVLAGLLADDEAQRLDGDPRRHLQTPEERAERSLLVPVPFGRRGIGRDYADAYGAELAALSSSRTEPN